MTNVLLGTSAFFGAAGFASYLYTWKTAQKPYLIGKKDGLLYQLVKSNCSVLNEEYYPPWWAPTGILQTGLSGFVKGCPVNPYEREIFDFEDEGICALDWVNCYAEQGDETPIVLLLPGLTGSSHDSPYICHLLLQLKNVKYRGVVFNMRGIGVELKNDRTFSAHSVEDCNSVVRHIHSKYLNAPIMIVGFSLGGINACNYLASHGEEATACNVKAAMVVSVVFDPAQSCQSLEKLGFWPKLLFNSYLAKCLKRIVEPYRHVFEQKVEWNRVMSSQTIRDFDSSFVAPMFGYRDCDHYYETAALCTKIDRFKIPILVLNAADDCFSPVESIPVPEVEASPSMVVIVTAHGGHTAFLKSSHYTNPIGVCEEVFRDFSKLVFTNLTDLEEDIKAQDESLNGMKNLDINEDDGLLISL